jgi:hypothetical protein
MPHLQVTDATARRAHQLAVHRTQLQAAHDAAKSRAAKIAAREHGVISIYTLGEVIAEIESEQAAAGARLDIDVSIALHSVTARLKALLPKH